MICSLPLLQPGDAGKPYYLKQLLLDFRPGLLAFSACWPVRYYTPCFQSWKAEDNGNTDYGPSLHKLSY